MKFSRVFTGFFMIGTLIFSPIVLTSCQSQSMNLYEELERLEKEQGWRIVYTRGTDISRETPSLFFLSMDGKSIPIFPQGDDFYVHYPSLSPDGKKVAFCKEKGDVEHVIITDLHGDNPKELLQISAGFISWSPDGEKIAFLGGYDEPTDSRGLYIVGIETHSVRCLVEKGVYNFSPPSWSPDGKEIVFQSVDGKIKIVNIEDGNVQVLTSGEAPSWSPDGKIIAYREGDIYYTISPDGRNKEFLLDGRETFLSGEVWAPVTWSPDGKFILFYRNIDHGDKARIYVMDVETKQRVQIDKILPAPIPGISWTQQRIP